jgi:ribosomal protein S18 acetylase RimI-like enzyme
VIRPIKIEDKKDWEKLYKGYADFYKVEMNDEILKTVWKWLFDQNHEVSGLVYEENSKVIALAHYRKMPSPLRGKYIGFLDDLFVDPEFRGQQIAQKLISHLKSLSKANNWDGIRWITHSSNENAKKLYDKIANNTGFELYELKGN